ncbi:uncharacterized protein TNCV_3335391 [Trichonephila clavipes]|nr:uncharacterized protein TNCV_3335391 [Trichonephila clavipes]
MTRCPSHDFRNTNRSANNQFTNRNRQENLRDTRVETRYHNTSRPQRESNKFGVRGVGDNHRFDSRRRKGQSDHRFNNHGGQQSGSRNGAFRGQNGQDRLKSLVIPDDRIKSLPIGEKPVEIDLSNTKLGERNKEELQDLFNCFKGLFSDKPGSTHVLYHEIDTGDQGPALKLSEFNIEWEHRPGTQNVVADVLSRNPVDNVERSQISYATLKALALNSTEQLIQEQWEDPELGHIYRYLENPEDGSVNATVCEEGRRVVGKFMPKFEGPYRVLAVQNNNLTISKRGRRVTVNIDQVRIYHPRNSETSSYDSINETTYEGKESSNWSNRSNSEKSRRSRKPSGNENKSSKSDKGNAGLEGLRVKRNKTLKSTGTSERYDGKSPKICRKRSCRGSDYEQPRKRKAPVLPQGLKGEVPSSLHSRSHKYLRKVINKHPSQEPEILSRILKSSTDEESNPTHQQSSRKTRMEADRTEETRISTHRGHSAAEKRPVQSRRKPTV